VERKKNHHYRQTTVKPEKVIFSGNNFLPYAILFFFAFLLYSNTLTHKFVMDDDAMITNHETVKKGFEGIGALWRKSSVYGSTKENFGTYRPLTMSFFAIEYSFFKKNPFFYHFVHVLLYALLCVIIYFLTQSLFKNISFRRELGWMASLLFVAHPIPTEVGANIKSVDEILSLLFCSLALLAGIKYAETSKTKFAAISFFAFLSGLFSKENSVTFLLIIPLALFLFSKANKKQIFLLCSLHAIALVIYFIMRNAALDPSPPIGLVNNSLAGATSPSTRYGTAFFILLKYIGLLFFAHPLCWDYGYNQIPLVSFTNPIAFFSVILHFSMGTYAVFQISRSTSQIQKLIAFCIMFYLLSFSISSNIFVLIGTTMAERLLFTPSLSFCILIAFAILKLFRTNPFLINLNFFPLFLILGLYSCKTFSRNADWKDNLTLFESALKVCPNSYRVNASYAWESILAAEKAQHAEEKKKRYENAVIYYQKAVAIYPNMENDWYNCGVAYSNLGQLTEAEKMYTYALRINPKHRNSHFNLAVIYMNRHDYASALKHYSAIYETEPHFMDVAFKIGLIHHISGNVQAAIPYYEYYYKNNPTNRDVINNLAVAYKAMGNNEKAAEFANKLQLMKQE
jgi:tetratricopeptide (TPR) repeat protein